MPEPFEHISQEDFDRYLRNEMTNTERHAFERRLERNPFAREALEGMESISPETIARDLEALEAAIKPARSRERRIFVYRIAAGIALLAGLSTAFILLLDHGTKPPTAEMRSPLNQEEKAATPVTKTDSDTIALAVNTATKKNTVAKTNQRKKLVPVNKGMEQMAPLADEAIPPDDTIIRVDAMKSPVEDLKEAQASGVFAKSTASGAPQMKESKGVVRGQILSSEDGQPLPGVTVNVKGTSTYILSDSQGRFELPVTDSNVMLTASFIGMEREEKQAREGEKVVLNMKPSMMALNEVVVVSSPRSSLADKGYAVKKVELNPAEGENTYHQAEPEGGYPAFNKYVQSHLRFPSGDETTRRALVVLEFSLGAGGVPLDITVIKSPGKEYSDIATEVLRNGPVWKPSTMGTSVINERLRIRMVFKRP